jgi:hypothetical protein
MRTLSMMGMSATRDSASSMFSALRIAEAVPDRLQGRVSSAARQLIVSLMLVAPLLIGALLDGVGPVATVAVDTALLAALALALTASRVVRRSADEPVLDG